jgi:hypothetical protein
MGCGKYFRLAHDPVLAKQLQNINAVFDWMGIMIG